MRKIAALIYQGSKSEANTILCLFVLFVFLTNKGPSQISTRCQGDVKTGFKPQIPFFFFLFLVCFLFIPKGDL